MATSAQSLNHDINESVAHKGFWTDLGISLDQLRTNADPPAVLTGATTPLASNSAGTRVVRWATTTTTGFSVSVPLPRNYALGIVPAAAAPAAGNKITGALRLHLLMRSAVAAVTIGGTTRCDIYARNGYTGLVKTLKGPFTPRTSSGGLSGTAGTVTLTDNPTNPEEVILDFTGALDSNNDRIEPGDNLLLLIGLNAHGNSGNVDLHGVRIAYRANAAFTRRAEQV